MKYLSLFSGMGGFEKGIQQAYDSKNLGRTTSSSNTKDRRNKSVSNKSNGDGWRTNPCCIGYSEINKYAIQIYEKHFPEHKNYGDITNINVGDLPDFDLLVGGFPCQTFSIAGKRRGFDEARGTLFFEILRICAEKRPRFILLENVKGLLSHDGGKTFQTILRLLSDVGFRVEWQVLNSKDFGVPQNRERVFIVGHTRGESRRQIFPIEGESGKSCKIVGRLDGLNGHDYLKRVYSIDGSSPTLPTGSGGNHEGKFLVPVLTPDRAKKRQNGRRFKENGDPSFTLTAQDKHGIYDGSKIRRLTPTECMRLQGFPDDWCDVGADGKEISDSQKYKMAGNAVTVNVIQAIMQKLLKI